MLVHVYEVPCAAGPRVETGLSIGFFLLFESRENQAR